MIYFILIYGNMDLITFDTTGVIKDCIFFRTVETKLDHSFIDLENVLMCHLFLLQSVSLADLL